MIHRGLFQPLPFCDSVIFLRGGEGEYLCLINFCVQCKLSKASFCISPGSPMVGTSRGKGWGGMEKKILSNEGERGLSN